MKHSIPHRTDHQNKCRTNTAWPVFILTFLFLQNTYLIKYHRTKISPNYRLCFEPGKIILTSWSITECSNNFPPVQAAWDIVTPLTSHSLHKMITWSNPNSLRKQILILRTDREDDLSPTRAARRHNRNKPFPGKHLQDLIHDSQANSAITDYWTSVCYFTPPAVGRLPHA